MKKSFYLLVTALFFISTASVSAQSNFGIRAGINFSTQSYGDLEDIETGSLAGFHLGVNYEIASSDFFAIRLGILYAQKGGSTSIDNAGDLLESDNKYQYLYIPIDLVFDLTVVDIFAGPYFQYALSGKRTQNGINVDFDFDESDISRTDYGLNLGANIDIFDKVYVGGYYSLGLGNLNSNNDVDLDVKNSSLNLFITYRI